MDVCDVEDEVHELEERGEEAVSLVISESAAVDRNSHRINSSTHSNTSSPVLTETFWNDLEKTNLVPCLFVSILSVIIMIIVNNIHPFTRIFYITDSSLWFPQAAESTVPYWQVILICCLYFIIPFLIEYTFRPKSRTIRDATFIALRVVFAYFTQFLLTIMFTEILKVCVGSLRPDFAFRCFGPDFTPSYPTNLSHSQILSDAECPNQQDMESLIDGRKSFPSGHTSTAFSGAFFISLYIFHSTLRIQQSTIQINIPTRSIIVTALQIIAVAPLIYASYVAVSRLRDYRHSCVDVLAGAVLALFFSCVYLYQVIIGANLDENEHVLDSQLELCRIHQSDRRVNVRKFI